MDKLNIPDVVNAPVLRDLHSFLDERIIGQERARDAVVDSFNIAMAGLNPDHHPITALLLLGPTGVGKTELMRAVADYFYEKYADKIKAFEDAARKEVAAADPNKGARRTIKLPKMVKVNCGKYAGSMSHAVLELLGAPVSYVGREQAPKLSRWNFPPGIIRVLLFDEFEKAYVNAKEGGAELTGILMDLLDEARIENNHNEEVLFVWTVIAFTSNYGAREIFGDIQKSGDNGPTTGFGSTLKKTRRLSLNLEQAEEINEKIYRLVMDKIEDPATSPFPPELMNRMDRVVVFRFLTREEYGRILDKEIGELHKQIAKWNSGILLRFTPEAKSWIIANGIDFQYGVRSLQRFLRRKIRKPVAKLLNGKLAQPGDIIEVRVEVGGKDLSFWRDPNPQPALVPKNPES